MSTDLDSTLIRRGRSAVTLTEMAAFVRALENRPLPVLLEDLPHLAELSETKFTLAIATLRRRFRGEPSAVQFELLESARRIAGGTRDAYVSDRIREMFYRDTA